MRQGGINTDEISLSSAGIICRNGFTKEEFDAVTAGLYDLLAKQAAKYTFCDSASMPSETAAELFKSICFTVNYYLDGSTDLLKSAGIARCFTAGREKIATAVSNAKELFAASCKSAPHTGSAALRDTLREIGCFFRRYDMLYFAHDIPCSIDYQLCSAVSESRLGIDYITEYLKSLLIENQFCALFPTADTRALLRRACPDFELLICNIFEFVLANALGSFILSGSAGLFISKNSLSKLHGVFAGQTAEYTSQILKKSALEMCSSLDITEESSVLYISGCASSLAPRIASVPGIQGLGGVFIPLGPQ